MKRVVWRLVWMMAVVFGSLMGAAHPKAMIIFDASGSMWGQIDGVNKIVIARDALKSVVEQWNPKVALGLTVYGHRVKGDCNDIQTVIPIGKVNKKQMIDRVYGIMPKGMTPIAKSLRQVANTLRQSEDQTTIILISDGRESCEEDPCATAKQLKAEGINFVAHVVGFNVDANTDRQLACVAKATGGEYFSAKNAAALNKAIKVIAKKVEKPKPKPKPKPVEPKNTTLELLARYQMSPKALNVSGMQWEVTQGDKILYSGSEENPKIPAKVGTVHIKASYSRTSEIQKVEGDITLKAKKNNSVTIQLKSGKVIIDTAEEQGGPKIKSSVRIYPILEGKANLNDEIAWCIPTKSKACERILPIGTFLIKASYNGMETEQKLVLGNKEKKAVHLYFRQTGQIETSASETEGGKWIDAHHNVYEEDDGKPGSHLCAPYSYKKEQGKCRLPVGRYIVKSTYNQFKKQTPIEIKAGETLKLHVIFGSTGTIETSASETGGGKWIDAHHFVYEDEDGKPGRSICTPYSYKKETGTCKLPVGRYIVKSTYNEFKKFTPVEVKPGKTTKLHVVFGATGIIETSASETEGGKWIDAHHFVYEDVDGKPGRSICTPYSYKKETGTCKLPVGKYIVKSTYNEFKKQTPVEVKPGETTKLYVIFGSTGTIETSASETEGGKWIDAHHNVYEEDDGKPGSHVCSPYSYKKEQGKCRLPVGRYIVKSIYNQFKKQTPIEIKAGETLKLHVVFGNTGTIETSASETKGGKWVDASHSVYTDDEGKPGDHICSPYSYKNETGKCKLPVGKYIVKSRYKGFEKRIPIRIKAGEVSKLHVVFSAVAIQARCIPPNARISYEIYAPNGQLVYEKRTQCDQIQKVVLDAGNYTLDVQTSTAKITQKITVGTGTNQRIVSDMTQADTGPSSTPSAVSTPISNASFTPQAQLQKLDKAADAILKGVTQSANDHKEDMKKAGELLNALGGLLGNMQATSKQKKKQNIKREAEKNSTDKAFDEMSKDLELFTK